jgi:tetratricopeptide (TPR) repeat protein
VAGTQRLPRRVPLLLAVTGLLVLRAPAFAQTSDDYVGIVEQYAAGDESSALALLAPQGGRLSSAIVEHMRQLTERHIRSAIMLHTELAATWLATAQTGPAVTQIANAQRLLAILTDDTGRRAAAQAFAIRWYAFATNLYAEQGLFDPAFRVARDGLAGFPQAPELYLARGTVYEMHATLAGNSRFASVVGDRVSSDIRRMFEAAAVDYQRALDIDGAFALAHLHRGWVHYHLYDSRAAQELNAALREAKDDGVRYLAHLFLGAVAERRKDLEAASRQFEAANSLGPFQTSTVALGEAEAALGHAERASAITAQYAARRDATTEDPWWSYRIGGFAPGAVTWLRQEARRP